MREINGYFACHPDDPYAYIFKAELLIDGFGDLKGARAMLEEGMKKPPFLFRPQGQRKVEQGNMSRLEFYERNYDSAFVHCSDEITKGIILNAMGRKMAAQAWFDSSRIRTDRLLRAHPESPAWQQYRLGLALGWLGKTDQAIRLISASIDSATPPAAPCPWRLFFRPGLAQVLIAGGQYERAVALIEELLSEPGPLSVWQLRLSPLYDPLRSNERFQALLATHK